MRSYQKNASRKSLAAIQARWTSALREEFSSAEQVPGSAAQQLNSSASTGGNYGDADAVGLGDAEGAALPLHGPGRPVPVPRSPGGRADPPQRNGTPTLISPTVHSQLAPGAAVPPPRAPPFSTHRTTRARCFRRFHSYSLQPSMPQLLQWAAALAPFTTRSVGYTRWKTRAWTRAF